jgi:hypothetical protein
MDNREAVEYWELIGCTSSPREQATPFAQLAQQNKELLAEVAQLKAQVATLSAKSSKEKMPLAESVQQRKKQQKSLPAKQMVAAKPQSDKETEKSLAINPKIMATVRRLAALEACAGIAQADMYAVIQAHQQGIGKSKIYQHLGWGSKKHTHIVKPVIDELASSKALQAV